MLHTESPRQTTQMRWGFITGWSPQPGSGQLLINAKAETIMEKRTFKEAFTTTRCLVIADSFYEWRRDGTAKQPVRFLLKSGEAFAFAGLWHRTVNGDAFVIITTAPNDLVRPVHTRMPAMLDREDFNEWLSPDTSPDKLMALLRPVTATRMKAYDVDPIVGNAKIDSPQCIEPYRPMQGSLF